MHIKTITQRQALTMLSEAFKEPLESLAPERARESIAGWDSWGAVMLLVQMDERFSLAIDVEASRAMTRVGDVLAFLRRHGVLED